MYGAVNMKHFIFLCTAETLVHQIELIGLVRGWLVMGFLPAGCAKRIPPGIVFTHGPNFRFFAPMKVQFGMEKRSYGTQEPNFTLIGHGCGFKAPKL